VALTVTATAGGGGVLNGLMLVVRVVNNAATVQNGAAVVSTAVTKPQSAITPHATGSFVYGSVLENGTTAYSSLDANTNSLYTAVDSTNGITNGAYRSKVATTTTASTTFGWAAPTETAGNYALVSVEILSNGGTIAEDASTPATVYTASATTATTASFTPPTGSVLVAMVSNNTTGVTLTTMALSDSASAYTWTEAATVSAQFSPALDIASIWVGIPKSATPVTQADVAAAVEALAITVPQAPVDLAGAVDALVPAAAAPQLDTAGAVDALAINSAVALADSGSGTDGINVTLPAPSADTAGAVEHMVIAVAAPMADRAGADELMVNTSPYPADTAGAVDKLAAAVTDPVADRAGAVDSLVVSATAPRADTAGAVEHMVIAVTAPMADTAGAVEIPSAGPAGSVGTIGGTLPGAVLLSYNSPGYAGGPSGAAAVTPANPGSGWEVYAYSAADYVTMLARIPDSMVLNWQFVRQLDDIGSATVVLSTDDPWWSDFLLPGGLATETLLDEECLWVFCKDGVPRFDFLGETVTEQLVDQSEQRQVTITGPGTIATLKWAMVAPQGFPEIVLKLDGILDSFDEVDGSGNSVVDTNTWTTLSPSDHVYITPIANIYSYPGGTGYALGTLFPSGSMTIEASPGTTFLGASPWDATDTLISAQITPIGVSSTTTDSTDASSYGTGLNGSELTQFYIQSNFNSGNYMMIGLSGTAFYAQLGTSGKTTTKVLPAYDASNHAYWMITEQAGTGGGSGTFYVWTSPDGQTWTLQWQVVHSWDATDVTFYVTAYYSVDKTESVVLTNLNSNVTTPSYQGAIYLGVPLMGVWLDQFSTAQARGTIPFVTSNVTAGADTYGRAWADTENVQAINGTDLYTLLQSGTAVVNADYVMDPGFQLRVGQPAAGQVAVGVDRSNYLILRESYDTISQQRVRARNQIQTLIGGENSDGHEIAAYSSTYIAKWGQREGWFQAAVQIDPTSMAYATAASLAQFEDEVLSWTISLVPNLPGKTVFDDFDVGDWLGVELPDFSGNTTVRVTAIAVAIDSSGVETHELTLVSYMQWLAEQLTYLANKLGGQFVNSQGTSPVAPSKYGTGQVPTYFSPAATLAGLGDVSTHSAPSTTASGAPLVYNPATGQYQAAGSTDPVSGTQLPVTVASPSGIATVTDTTVTVVTGNGSTVLGLQPDGGVTSVDSGGTAPPVPDAPGVTGIVQGLLVTWDGLLAAAPPVSNFGFVQVYVGGSSGFIPSSANLAGTLSQAGALTVSNLTAGTTYYVKLAAVSSAGVASAATAAVAATAAGMPTAALTGQLPASLLGNTAGNALNPNPYFNGGDLTGWSVVNGTIAATASPPAGIPGNAPYCALVTATSANCLAGGSPAPFPVTPGQPYAMTSWVYNASGSAITVAIGFNWTSGTTTVSVLPGTWVPLTTVQTCPGGVTSAYQVIGPVTSGKAVYVSGAAAVGQVPGQLIAAATIAAQQIAANTITAAQIAANTITAAQIAANTITAGQIAASTITAAQIAATTITATQIAAHTITASQIAASTITATQIASNTITATQIQAGTVIAGVVNGTTITGASIIADGSSGEFLVYGGTPTSGNLLVAISGSAGSDSSGNPYANGITLSGQATTPTAISGSGILYGTSDGSLQSVDGLDGNTYQIQHLTQILTSNWTTTTTTQQTVWSVPIGPRSYRLYAWMLITANSAVIPAINIAGPGGSGGQFSVELARAASFYDLANFGLNGAIGVGGTSLTSGFTYVMRVDGIIVNSSSGTIALQLACQTTPNSFTVVQPSFMDLSPV
jgi:hypothetical protein